MNQLTFQDELCHRQRDAIIDKLAELDRRVPACLAGWFFGYDAGLYTLHLLRKGEPSLRTDAYPLPDLAIRAAFQIAAFYELLSENDLELSEIFRDNICHWPPLHFLGGAPVSRVIARVQALRLQCSSDQELTAVLRSWATSGIAPAAHPITLPKNERVS